MKKRQTRRNRRTESHDQTALAVIAMSVVRQERLGQLPSELRHVVGSSAIPRLMTPHARDIARCLQEPLHKWPKLKVSSEAKAAAEHLLSDSRRRFARYSRS